MLVSDFDFNLPPELIAQEPPAERTAARLLHLDRSSGSIVHTTIAALPDQLRAGDLVVVNNTRVFPARLIGRRVPSGGAVECLLIARRPGRPADDALPTRSQPARDPLSTRSGPADDPLSTRSGPGREQVGIRSRSGLDQVASGLETNQVRSGLETNRTNREQIGAVEWDALMHPGQKLRPGARVVFEGVRTLHAEVLEQHFFGRRTIRLWTDDGSPVDEAIDAIGHVPLPPYIKRSDSPADRDRYQTVFASYRGSVAAPTAGLHFTPALVEALAAHGVHLAQITLHVGYGTFQPVRVDRVEDHRLEAEHYSIDSATASAINGALAGGRRVIAVGTTTTRTLEAVAAANDGRIVTGEGATDLFIYPGHTFRVVSGLLTNFHLPRSSLIMLAAAFAGRDRVLNAYHAAIAARYRFYSYGDAMLIT
jgi:S-adenosylmethionine:tRNA ribosyltransferase-isomerase